jgi:hypothetical protein
MSPLARPDLAGWVVTCEACWSLAIAGMLILSLPWVFSYDHQTFGVLARDLRITATSDDGVGRSPRAR